MPLNQSIFSKNYFRYSILLVLIMAGILVWVSFIRFQAFHNYHQELSHETATGIEKQVAFYIAEKKRMVSVFADQQIDIIRALAYNPDNDDLRDNLGELITHYFPDRFAFSIANNSGEPLFENFDGLISELCLTDLRQFSTERVYHPYVHPNTEGYHFDIMVPYGRNGEEGILFISFLADVVGELINAIQGPEQHIMLIYPQRDNLIEIIAGSARNKLIRDDYRLSEQEMSQIDMRHPIAGTRWEVVNFHNDNIENTYRSELIRESILILSLFIVVIVIMIIRLRKEEVRRMLAERQKQELMGVISHEFRSPTSIIKSALDLVIDGDAGEINSDVKKFVNMALTSSSQLLLLVNDFLDIQKLESDGLVFTMQDIQLSRTIRNAVDANTMYATQFGVTYKLVDPLSDDSVKCDENRIGQVLTNLLSNAAKYGGIDDIIEVSHKNNGRYVRTSITDHGPGIPEDFQDRVFEMFAMAQSQNSNKKVASSGVGLSIAKAIVEKHGGHIGFDTEVGKGTTFWFELPIKKA